MTQLLDPSRIKQGPDLLLDFFVPGIPRPGGSKKAYPFRRDNGQLGVRVTDSGKHTFAWRTTVADIARQAMNEKKPYRDALFLSAIFYMPRPGYHFGRNGLLPKYEFALVCKKPDPTKLIRALEDALNGIVWQDDSQIIKQAVVKLYSETPGAQVRVRHANIFMLHPRVIEQD